MVKLKDGIEIFVATKNAIDKECAIESIKNENIAIEFVDAFSIRIRTDLIDNGFVRVEKICEIIKKLNKATYNDKVEVELI